MGALSRSCIICGLCYSNNMSSNNIVCECHSKKQDYYSNSSTNMLRTTLSQIPSRVGPQIDYMLSSSVLARRWPRSLSVSWHSTAAEQKQEVKLPPLPVPPLQSTLQKLLKTAKPHLSSSELCDTIKAIEDFGKKGGIGEELQARLENRANTKRNWLEDWWLACSYLGYRSPVVVHSSPGLVFPLQKFNDVNDRLLYAARTIVGALNYKLMIDNGKIPQDKQGNNPLDMIQYSRIFGVNRAPDMPLDRLRFADPNCPPKHITVVHNNQFFKVPVFNERGQVLDETQLLFMLKNVIDNSKTPGPPVGILTSAPRDDWSKAYKELSCINNGVNKKSIEEIESSLFVLALDQKNPEMPVSMDKRTVAALQMLHGLGSFCNSGNRWFDKTIQFIVGTHGEVGLCYEHSPAEGQPVAVMMDFILKHISSCKNEFVKEVTCPRPEPLPFVLNNTLECAIKDASRQIDSLIADVDMKAYSFKGYGKDFPKQNKMSPDSFIQMAMQLAFYRIHGVPAATYETASTRMFLGGRTETIRSCSEESTLFCKTMLDNCASIDDKFKSLKTAVNAHRAYTMEASKGLGVDRHLFGLKLIAQEANMDLPALYSDPGYTRSARMRISSSQVAASVEAVMCYGPLVPDGYACCYNPLPQQMMFAICAMNQCPETSAETYANALESSLLDMQKVVSSCSNLQSKL
ncbi:carnitine O-acetyltransferase isoform X1 [Frankliniella occidentalis]|uniref:Carnitine O-acetyltransferase isoform X1 n=2 Tax=Frankliniella occidentalis TaxID=133901 RepID=A0A6J1RXZ7_FRAOC|nr:carnitine O-acetyltransferase isoform X1 [Frankliniella occidentalis]